MASKYRAFPFIVDLPHAAAIETIITEVRATQVYMSCGCTHQRPQKQRRRHVVRSEIVAWLRKIVGSDGYVVLRQKGALRDNFPLAQPVRFRFAGKEKAALFKLFWYP